MLMDASVICKHCQKKSSVTPHAQTILCHGCGKIVIVGRNRKPVLSITNIESTREQSRVISDTKCPQNPFRMNWSGHASLEGASSSTKAKSEQCDTINSWEAPQGKRALLCGVTYSKQKFKLRGTINDVNNMRDLLVERYNFPRSSIHILTEGGPHFHPTKKNIQAGLRWLVKDCKAGDSLVFFFSGHGLRQPDFDDDELDGFDETICPVDFKTAGMIIDNEINETIVRPLKPGVRLHAIVDACHSGTILDLPYIYSMKDNRWMNNHPPSGAFKGTCGGEAICFSACEDDQFAEDRVHLFIQAFSGKQMAGAMTYNFIKAIKENPKITYGGLLISMHTAIKEARETGCLNLKRFFHRKRLQEPLLSSSGAFDINVAFNL